mmetsp:Transcript_4642/g.7046  ORF Transcript_4642/g.7046 Transcript_4642/m.7046 type:complete len:211 (-) Transcript_4642:1152-1784(-)
MSSSSKAKQLFLFIGNAAIHISWFHVLWGLIFEFQNQDEDTCNTVIRPRIITALIVSGIELLNSLLGLTKSKPHQVFLFSSVRMGVEVLLAPLLPCNSPQHLITVVCWTLDGIFRFGCFGLDALLSLFDVPSVATIKSVRYTVGPLLFPIGAGGEMFMALRAAKDGRPALYFAASLWPMFFYPLMKQLLKQRSRHFKKLREESAGSKKEE